MVNIVDKDPIEKLLERDQIDFDDLDKKEKGVEGKDDGKKELFEEKAKEETREDLNQVKETTQTQIEIKEELSVFSLITRTEILMQNFERIKNESRSLNRTRESKGERKIQRDQAMVQIKELENILNILKRYKTRGNHLDAESLSRYDQELKSKEIKLKQFEEQRDNIVLNQTGGNIIYEVKVNTLRDALKLQRNKKNLRKSLEKITETLRDAALNNEVKQELEGLKQYLLNALDNPDVPLEPFRLQHRQDIQRLNIIDPSLYYFIERNVQPSPQVSTQNPRQNTRGTRTSQNLGQTGTRVIESTRPICSPVQNYNNLDEAWKKGGVMGTIDYWFSKTNMSPQQRQFWNKAGNIAMIGGGIRLGWKALSSILGFDKNKGKDRWKWIGGIVGGTLLLQGTTGKNPIQALKELFNGGDTSQRISEIFGGKAPGGEIGPETPPEEIAYIHGFAGLPAIFGGMTIEQIKGIVKQEGGHTKISDYDILTTALRNGKTIDGEKGARMVETLAQDNDKYNIVGLTLDAMGLDRNTIQRGGDKKFEEYNLDAIRNLGELNSYMETKGYNGVNIDKPGIREGIRNFIATGIPRLEDLERDGAFEKGIQTDTKQVEVESSDWRIERFDIKDDKLGLKDKIDNFNLTELQKKNLIAAGNILSWDTKNTDIEFKEHQNKIYLKTYNEWTPIDITKKIIIDLDDNKEKIYFGGLTELVNAANLTNYIKNLFRGRYEGQVDLNTKYFARSGIIQNISDLKPLTGQGDLVYRMNSVDLDKSRYDPRRYKWAVSNTEVVDAGWLGRLKNISPTLNSNVSAYADYLNKLDIRHISTKDKGLAL